MNKTKIIAGVAALAIVCGAVAPAVNFEGTSFTASADDEVIGETVSNDDFIYEKIGGYVKIIDITETAKGDIVVPQKIDGLPVIEIRSGAFSNNYKIKTITISEGVITIGNNVFENDKSLKSVTIPSTVTSIGSEPFVESNSLETVTISKDNKNYKFEDGCLFKLDASGNYDTLCSYATAFCEPDKEITQPVKNVAFGAFTSLEIMMSLTLPDTVETIEECAFNNCGNLTYIHFPKNLKEIDSYGFFNCPSVYQIFIDESNENFKIESNVLYNKSKDVLFYYAPMSHVNTFNVPASVRYIQPLALNYACVDTVVLPDNLEYIAVGSFDHSDVKEITFEGTNDNYLCEDGILYEKGKKGIVAVPPKKKIDKFVVPDTVDRIYTSNFVGALDGAKVVVGGNTKLSEFAFFESKLAKISIDEGTAEIPEYCFYFCPNLNEVDIPMSVTIIQANAFQNCESLRKIAFSKNVDEIRPNALNNCEKLESITIENPECFIDIVAMDKVREDGNVKCTITGYDDSTAERYAALWGFKFDSLGAAPSGKSQALGDVNGDGRVDSADASAVLAEYALVSTGGKETFNYEKRVAADVNADNSINSADASKILEFYSYVSTGGKITDMADWMTSKG